MRARYYNPEIMRFVNRDVLLGSVQNTLSLNRYAYCQSNPVTYIDPQGKFAFLILLVPEIPAATVVIGGLVVTAIAATGELIIEIKDSYFSDSGDEVSEDAGGNSFNDNLRDINDNPDNWEKTGESIENSTNTKLKGGKSIEEEFTNKYSGDKIWRHILENKNGNIVEKPHYRPYPKQCR